MPTNSPTNRKLSNPSPARNQLVERCSSLRGCEPCKRRKRICNGQRPCTHCVDASQDCVYSAVSDHSRSVFTTNTARRLSSGSACETCRRRKTKCDGGSPCGFCSTSGIECINNSERRKRSITSTTSSSSSSSLTTNLKSPLNPSSLTIRPSSDTDSNDVEAIDRIEDRLKRIEKLMTAFSPNPSSQQAQLSNEIKEIRRATTGFRKLSSPHIERPASAPIRQQRHSIQGYSSAPTSQRSHSNKDVFDTKANTSSPPHQNSNPNGQTRSQPQPNQFLSPSPPLSPYQSRQSTNMVASTLLTLSLSPSSSTSSSSSMYQSAFMQPSASTPARRSFSNSTSNNTASLGQSMHEWKQSAPIPSLMDQLSKCTFATTAIDHSPVHYPIYPLSPNHPSNVTENA